MSFNEIDAMNPLIQRRARLWLLPPPACRNIDGVCCLRQFSLAIGLNPGLLTLRYLKYQNEVGKSSERFHKIYH